MHIMNALLIGPPDPEIAALEAQLRDAQLTADVAVVALRARLVVEVAGTLVSGTYRYTRIWAREHGGHWQVVGGHVSEIASA